MAPLVAIVGSDGSGKSTAGAALLEWLQERRPAELCHLGKQTGSIGRSIARWPLIGRRLDKTISAKAGNARQDRGPGPATALVIYLFSMRRVRRFRRMLTMRGSGVTILADRFPQIEIPGPMDGLGFASTDRGSAFSRALARRERRHYAWMMNYPPDLIIRLNVDLDTAMARKPDHRPSSLRTKIGDLERLTFNGAPIVDIDATQPLADVLNRAKAAIVAAIG